MQGSNGKQVPIKLIISENFCFLYCDLIVIAECLKSDMQKSFMKSASNLFQIFQKNRET